MKDIRTDEDFVEVLDELMFRLKAGQPHTPMRNEFISRMLGFISYWGLDKDTHAFASLPEDN